MGNNNYSFISFKLKLITFKGVLESIKTCDAMFLKSVKVQEC